MTWLAVTAVLTIYVALSFAIASLVGQTLKTGCLCQRHFVSPRCPVHGRGR